MNSPEIARANASGAVDFVLESASPARLVVVGFVDDPSQPIVRLVFETPMYVQLPLRFSWRQIEARPLAEMMKGAPVLPRWELPADQAAPSDLPSLSFEELHELDEEGGILFAFVSHGATPAEPPCFVVARRMKVVLARSNEREL